MADRLLDWTGTSITFATAFGATFLQAFALWAWLNALRTDRRWRVVLPSATLIIATVAGIAIVLDASLRHLPIPLALLAIGSVLVMIGLCRMSGAARMKASAAPVNGDQPANLAEQQTGGIVGFLNAVATSIAMAAPLATAVALTMIGIGAESGLPRSALMGTIVALVVVLPFAVLTGGSFSVGALRRQVLIAGAAQTALGTLWLGEALVFGGMAQFFPR